MRRRSRQEGRGGTSLRMLLLTTGCAVFLLPLILLAGDIPDGKPINYPLWWFQQDVIIPKEGAINSPMQWPADFPEVKDYTVINQGQLKWMAKGAFLHLQDKFSQPGVPGTITASPEWTALSDLIQEWDTATNAMDYAAANQGQVKEVSRHFYEVFALPEVGYYTNSITGWTQGDVYPWTGAASAEDFGAVNQGQLKNLFAFDLTNWEPVGGSNPLDTDGDGLLDSWEQTIVDADPNDAITSILQVLASNDGSSPSLYWDFDGDGYDNLTEHTNTTDPTDFYNGATSLIVVVEPYGNNQLVWDGYFSPPLQIKITDSQGGPFQNGNVPVTFAVSGPGGVTLPGAGGGEPDSSEEPAQSLTVVTTRNGSNEDIATVYFSSSLPGESSVTVSVEAPGATPEVLTLRAWHDSDLIAFWTLDEEDGTVAEDSSGFGQDAALNGDPVRTASWNNSLALSLDGTDDYLLLSGAGASGLNFTDQSFTLSLWVNTNSTVESRLAGKGFDSWSDGYYAGLNADGKVVAGIGGGTDAASILIRTKTTAVNDGKWHHVAIVYPKAGSTTEFAQIYVDGEAQELEKADANTGGTLAQSDHALDVSALSNLALTSTEPFSVGAHHDGTSASSFYTGLIDDVRVYKAVLNPSQVLALTDSDSDALPDVYEYSFFPDDPDALTHLSGHNEADFDGDGMYDLAEYQHKFQQGSTVESDPTDYYSQGELLIIPEIEVVSGTPQTVDAGTFSTVLVAKVYEKDTNPLVALVNAPVDFSVYVSTGRVSASIGSDPLKRSVIVRTVGANDEAHASAYFQAPTAFSTTAQVKATTGKVSPVHVSYTINVDGPPERPTDILVAEQTTSDPNDDQETQYTVEWSDNSDDETGFTIEYQLADGSWVTLATVNPDTVIFNVTEAMATTHGILGIPNIRVKATNSQGYSESEESNPEKPAPRYAVIDLGPGVANYINENGAVAIQQPADSQNSIPAKAYYWENGEKSEITVPNSLYGVHVEGLNDDGIVICSWWEDVTIYGYTEEKKFAGYSEKGESSSKLDIAVGSETLDDYISVNNIFIKGDIVYAHYSGSYVDMLEWNPYNGSVKFIADRGPALNGRTNEIVACANKNGDGIFEIVVNYDEFTYILCDLEGNEIKLFPIGEYGHDVNNERIVVGSGLNIGNGWWDGKWHSLGDGAALNINNRSRLNEDNEEIDDYQILGVKGLHPDQEYQIWEKRDSDGNFVEHYNPFKIQDLLHDSEKWEIKSAQDINDRSMIVGQAEEYSLDENGKRTGSPIATKAVFLLPVDFDVYPHPDEEDVEGNPVITEVSADDAKLVLVASVYTPGIDEDGKPSSEPVEDGTTIKWEIDEGNGTLSEQETNTDKGITSVTLSTSTTPGDKYRVKATIKKLVAKDYEIDFESNQSTSGLEAYSGEIEVVAGAPYSVVLTEDKSSVRSDATDQIEFEAVVKDQFDNHVEDGTSITWLLDSQTGKFDDAETEYETAEGKVKAVVIAPMLPDDIKLTVLAGEVSEQKTITVSRVTGSITSSSTTLDIATSQTATITVSANAADGTPVMWITSNGDITTQSSMSGGTATATLKSANGRLGDVYVGAKVGERMFSWKGEFIASTGPALGAVHPILLSNVSTNGTQTMTRYDGTSIEVASFGTTIVNLRGTPNTTDTITLLESAQTAYYPCEEIESNSTVDIAGGYDLALSNVTLNDNEFYGDGEEGGSLEFSGSSTATASHSETWNLNEQFEISLWVRPTQLQASTVVSKGSAWNVKILADGKVQANLESNTGSATVTSTESLPLNYWTLVSIQFLPGQLNLRVGNSLYTSITGTTANVNTDAIIYGNNFKGQLDDIRMVSQVLGGQNISLGGLGSGNTVTYDANGDAFFTITNVVNQGDELVIARREYFVEKTLPNGEVLIYKVVEVDTATFWFYFYDPITSFWGVGDQQTTVGMVTGTTGSMLIVGDLGAILKQILRHNGWGDKDPNTLELVFSIGGLITEIPWFKGADGMMAALKLLAVKYPNNTFLIKFADIIWAYIVDVFRGVKNFDARVITYITKIATDAFNDIGLLRLISQFSLTEFVLSSKLYDKFSAPFQNLLKKLAADGDDVVGKKLMTSLDLDDAILDGLKNNPALLEDALKGAAKVLKYGIDPVLLKKILANDDAFTPIYTRSEFLVDCNKLLESSPMVKDLDDLMGKIANQTPSQGQGFTMELLAAAHKSDSTKILTLGDSTMDAAKIDFEALNELVQVKVTYNTLLNKAKSYLRKKNIRFKNDEEAVVHYLNISSNMAQTAAGSSKPYKVLLQAGEDANVPQTVIDEAKKSINGNVIFEYTVRKLRNTPQNP